MYIHAIRPILKFSLLNSSIDISIIFQKFGYVNCLQTMGSIHFVYVWEVEQVISEPDTSFSTDKSFYHVGTLYNVQFRKVVSHTSMPKFN